MTVNDVELTERILRQGKALVRAIEALETIDPSGLPERLIVRVLLDVYRRRLRGIVALAPSWMGEEILSASEGIDEHRPVHWISTN